jgi:alkane 1-monooxygenase
VKTFFKSIPFAIALTIPLGGIRLALHPTGIWLVLSPVVVFGMVPILDLFFGREQRLLEETVQPRDWRYDVWLWLWVPLQLAAIGLGVAFIAGNLDLTWSTVLVAACSMGVVSGIGINVAHELMHRRGRLERALAEVLMTSASYTHFCVEHILGHHKHVATPADPASARLGESVYAFLPRTLVGGFFSAWKLETRRVRAAGLARVSLKDRRLRYGLELLGVYAFCFLVSGLRGVMFFGVQSLVGMTLLEVINYIEHYGLSREELSSGKFERCLPRHSWNASERLTNWFLFHLQRHADHHYLASRPFASLRHVEQSPQLPTGYAGMIVLAMFPPLWKRVMNPRVIAWNQKIRTELATNTLHEE